MEGYCFNKKILLDNSAYNINSTSIDSASLEIFAKDYGVLVW